MRKLLTVLSAVTVSSAILFSCGGGGGGGSLNSSSQESLSRAIAGGVSASIVSNATVCLEDENGNIISYSNGSEACQRTDGNGTFIIQLPPDLNLNGTMIALFVEDENGDRLKIGEANYTDVERLTKQIFSNATDNLVNLNPLSLAILRAVKPPLAVS